MSRYNNYGVGTVLFAALITLSCASQPHLPSATDLQVNELLADVAPGDNRCLSTSQYDSIDVLNDRQLLFRGIGKNAWLNNLRHDCPGLRHDDTLLLELHSSQACALDRISVIDRFGPWSSTGPSCALGEFTKLDEGRVVRLYEILKSR